MENNEQEIATKRYIAIPKYKSSFLEVGEYTKTLSTGKDATIQYTTVWRWGECCIEITKEQRKNIIRMDDVCLEDYGCEFIESHDGWFDGVKLENKDDYTQEEMREIVKSMNPGDESDSDDDTEDNEPTVCTDDCACNKHQDDDSTIKSLYDGDTEYMEEEGEWCLDETRYYIVDGCVLVPEDENVEDYALDDGTYANKEEEEENSRCIRCKILLERARDGEIKEGFRCNNCYWEEEEGKQSKNMITPDYRYTEEEEEIVYLNTVGGKIVGGGFEPPNEDKVQDKVNSIFNIE